MKLSPTDRRTFLKTGVLIGASVAFSPWQTAVSAPPSTPLPWYRRPLRILQTVLREPEADGYDAEAVVAYMQKAACNLLVVNAGGIVDFFRNPLQAANPNGFMGDRDLLKEITEACRRAGIRVIGRVDFRGVEEHIYRQHPDWFSVDADGNPLQLDYTRPRLYAACYTGYYRNEHAEAFIRYLLEHYALDGIWHNSIGVQGICHCDRCRDAWQAHSGRALPGRNAAEKELDAYMEWKSREADRHMAHMKRTVKSFGDDRVYTAEVFSMFESGGRIHSGIDLYNARDHFDFLVSVAFLTENSDHIRYEDLSYAGSIIRFLKSMAPEKEAIILYGGNGTAHRYVMDPPLDLQVWLWEALSAGGRFWNCNFTGSHPDATYDRRNAFNNTAAYRFVQEHEKLLEGHTPAASVAVFYSRPTRLYFRQTVPEGNTFADAIKGVETVLMEQHIPFDFLADDQLSAERLRRYRLMVLPDVKCLSDSEIALLTEFVAQGGNLLATYESSLFDEKGAPRGDFGLAPLFGCRYSGEKVNTRKDCYQYISDPAHPLVNADSGATRLLINAGHTLICHRSPEARQICSYVPVVHNQPPEKAWTREWPEQHPTVTETAFGKGRVIYFANQPDSLSYEPGHPDMRNLLHRAIRLLAGDSIALETNAPPSVHAGLTRSVVRPNAWIFSFVNTSSAPVRPLRGLIPVTDLEATLRLVGSGLLRHQVLRAQGDVRVRYERGRVRLQLGRLEDYFSVYLEMRA
jgi:hypothetical protein